MAAGDTALGTGSTFTFSNVTGELLSLSYSGSERKYVDVPHMGTTGAAPRLVSTIYTIGTITAELHLEGDLDIDTAMGGAAASLVIVLGDTSSWTQNAALVGWEWNDPLDDVMTATATFALTGKLAATP